MTDTSETISEFVGSHHYMKPINEDTDDDETEDIIRTIKYQDGTERLDNFKQTTLWKALGYMFFLDMSKKYKIPILKLKTTADEYWIKKVDTASKPILLLNKDKLRTLIEKVIKTQTS